MTMCLKGIEPAMHSAAANLVVCVSMSAIIKYNFCH